MRSLESGGKKIWGYILDNSIYFLNAALLIFIIVPPFLPNEFAFRNSILILSTFILAFVILIIPRQPRKLALWKWIMVLLLFFPWLMGNDQYFDVFILLVLALLYSYTSYRIILIILKEKNVDLKVVAGSVVGYLMVGLSFTFICAILVMFYPDAYRSTAEMESPYSFIYYTFITLSTLGYGDVVPAIPQSQALSIFITIFGQFYMVVVVAVIVGKFLNKKD